MSLLLLASAMAAAQAPAAAQPVPEPGSDEVITVTGERVNRTSISRFVDQLVQQPRGLVPSRWTQQVCPSVHGLRSPVADRVEARMRAVAEAAGLRTAKPGCVANVVVVVAPNKALFLKDLERRKSFYFDGMPSWKVKDIIRNPAPAVAWHLRGLPVAPGGKDVQQIASGVATGEERPSFNGHATRLRAAESPTFDSAVVVVDVASINGLTVTQLADYAAMRAYLPLRRDKLKVAGASTILTVIDAPANAVVPASLTRWDLGLLRGLYATDPYHVASTQRSEIKRSVERQLTRRKP